MRKIELDGKEYDLVCNLGILEELQDEFGGITPFEKKLIGIVGEEEKKDKHGRITTTPVFGEPSFKAVRIGLFLMINEAIKIKNEEGAGLDLISMEEIKRMQAGTGDISKLANILHEEFVACFKSKNPKKEEKSPLKKVTEE